MRSFLLSVLAITMAPSVASAQGMINFDRLVTTGPGQGGKLAVYSQFAAQGVTFNGPVAVDYSKGLAIPGFAHSGTIAIEHCYGKEFCTTPIEMRFTTGQAMVRFWAGTSQPIETTRVVLARAYDASGNLVAARQTAFGHSKVPVPIRNIVQFSMTSPIIRRVTVSYQSARLYSNGLAIDSVEFSTAGPPPPCPASGVPVITMTNPANGLATGSNRFLLGGSIDIRGGTLSSASIAATSASGAKTLNLLGGLVKTGGGLFGTTWIYDLLSPGTNSVRLTVANCRGTAQASRTLTYEVAFELLHLETTQATQTMANDVPLVAGKATVVRAYLRLQGGTGSIGGITGELVAVRDDGTPAPGPARVVSMNTVEVGHQTAVEHRRLDLDGSLNFLLPDGWVGAGRVHIRIGRLLVGGTETTLPCHGCNNTTSDGSPALLTFNPTRRLNLILAPYVYQPPGEAAKTPELPRTIDVGLQWVNNLFPLAGGFPDNERGVNLIAVLPLQTTTRDLTCESDASVTTTIEPGYFPPTCPGRKPFQTDLQKVLEDWRAANPGQPADTRLLAIVPCDCGGQVRSIGGNVGFSHTWPVEAGWPYPSDIRPFAETFAHELGHMFGREHAIKKNGVWVDENWPYANEFIQVPGLAIITEWWGGSPFVLSPFGLDQRGDIMSYAGNRWISPYTYRALYEKLRQTALLTLPEPAEALLVAGTVSADLTVTLRHGFRNTLAASSAGTTGEFTVKLLGKAGDVLLAYRFDASDLAEDSSGDRVFSEFVPWRAGTRRLVIEREGAVLAERTVSEAAPQVSILSPRAGDLAGDELFISWSGADADGDALVYSVFVKAGDDLWLPVATDIDTTFFTLNTSSLPETAGARVRIRVTDGVNSSEAISEPFTVLPK